MSSPVAAPTTALSCPGCFSVIDVAENETTAVCIYCATPGVVKKPRTEGPRPAYVMPFIVGKDDATKRAKHWLKTQSMFAHGGLKRADVEHMRGVYVPAGLWSAAAETRYSAEIGENYTETQTYTTTVNGKSVTRTRTVTKTEWRSLSGDHAAWVTDVIVSASKGIPNRELDRVEPFDLRVLRRANDEMLVGWAAEEPTLTVEQCKATAREEAMALLGKQLDRFMPGDSHRALRFTTDFEHESVDIVQLPLWVLAVRYDKKKPALRLLVNGQTGEVGADVPWSKLKIALAIIVPLVLIGGTLLAMYLLGYLDQYGFHFPRRPR